MHTQTTDPGNFPTYQNSLELIISRPYLWFISTISPDFWASVLKNTMSRLHSQSHQSKVILSQLGISHLDMGDRQTSSFSIRVSLLQFFSSRRRDFCVTRPHRKRTRDDYIWGKKDKDKKKSHKGSSQLHPSSIWVRRFSSGDWQSLIADAKRRHTTAQEENGRKKRLAFSFFFFEERNSSFFSIFI